jgi:hypothetical protein
MYEGDPLRRNDFAKNKLAHMSSGVKDAGGSRQIAIFANFGWAEKKPGDIISGA